MIMINGITEEQLEQRVFELWEVGRTWEEIADGVYIPLPELLTRPGILELYNK